jgi:hypothetical protein
MLTYPEGAQIKNAMCGAKVHLFLHRWAKFGSANVYPIYR